MDAEQITDRILGQIPAFDDALALRTYAHLSHTPEDRARRERDGFRAHVTDVATIALKTAETPEQLAELDRAVSEYATGYLARLNAVLAARSRTASSFITGGANFPTKRNNKALAIESNREQELIKYQRVGMQRVRDRIAALETPEQKSGVIIRRICAAVDKELATIHAIENGIMPGFETKAFVSSIARIVRGLYRQGFRVETNAVLNHIDQRKAELGITNPSDRNGIWNLRTEGV